MPETWIEVQARAELEALEALPWCTLPRDGGRMIEIAYPLTGADEPDPETARYRRVSEGASRRYYVRRLEGGKP